MDRFEAPAPGRLSNEKLRVIKTFVSSFHDQKHPAIPFLVECIIEIERLEKLLLEYEVCEDSQS